MDFVRRPILCVLGWGIVLLVAAPPAFAEDSPAAATSMSAPASVAQAAPAAPGAPGSHKTQKSHKRPPLFDLTISPAKSFALGADQLVPPGTLSDNQIVINGELDVNVLPHLRLFEKRDNHYDVGGRTYKKGKPSYGGFAQDLEYDTGLAYAVTRQLEAREAYIYRYRVCCPNAGDPKNPSPRIEQGLRTTLTYVTGPQTSIGRPLRLGVEGTYVDHHLDLGVGLPGGTPVLGKTWVYKLSAYLSFPVFHQRQVVPYVGLEHYTDFFDNNLVPSMTNRTFYGIRLRGTPFVSYRAYVKNQHQANPGVDVPHKVELYTEASFKFHY